MKKFLVKYYESDKAEEIIDAISFEIRDGGKAFFYNRDQGIAAFIDSVESIRLVPQPTMKRYELTLYTGEPAPQVVIVEGVKIKSWDGNCAIFDGQITVFYKNGVLKVREIDNQPNTERIV